MGAMKAWYMEAIELIRDYVRNEYDEEMDDSEFENLEKVCITYTTVYTSDNEELPLEIFVDIPHCMISFYVCGNLHSAEKYRDDEFLGALANLDFHEMVGYVESHL